VQRVDPDRFGYIRMLRALLPPAKVKKVGGGREGEVVVGDPATEAEEEPTGPLDEETSEKTISWERC
jgi:hypothetical protein